MELKLKFFTCKLVSFFMSLSLVLLLSKSSDDFFDCISLALSDVVLTPNDDGYSNLLHPSIQNLRFDNPTTTKPLAIITPLSYSHVQSTVICSVRSGIRIRIRSGGHDYEGLSSTSFDHIPFILLDLNQLRSVTVDLETNTTWVESGTTLGELQYWVSKKSNILGFPTGVCTSVGVGGHLSGGGFGMMARKYGLSADNVIDALIVDVNGFRAIRGGGGGSFGVVLSWKIKLVYVGPIVTVFNVSTKLGQVATKLVNKWQYISHKISDDLFINVRISWDGDVNRTMQVTFNSLFLGTVDKLMTTVNARFPELGLKKKDCIEMSWIESVVYFSSYLKGESIEALKERRPWPKSYFKIKSDYVQKPIPEEELEEILKWCLIKENLSVLVEPHGGRMSRIDESETPYPHREGNLYIIQYKITWNDDGFEASEKHIGLIKKIYEKMAPFVSNNPREAYVNFRDMDVGINVNACRTSYSQATIWGNKYFKDNFRRLALVKGEVDPTNFFCYEQSIPPLFYCHRRLQNVECYKDDGHYGFSQN